MTYEDVPKGLIEEPLKVEEDEVLSHLKRTIRYHLKHTPYWKSFHVADEEIVGNTVIETVENMLNRGFLVEEDYLRANWPDFLPEGYPGRVRFYQSSGTTRERAIGHWDREYVRYLVSYLKSALDELYGLNETFPPGRMRALAHGPYGWYQDEISELVWSYGGYLYFIGMETDGLKKVLEEKGVEEVLRILNPLVRYTERVLKRDRINLARTAPPLIGLFKSASEDIEAVILSGVGTDVAFLKEVEEKFPNARAVPLYGYYLFGDLVGVPRKREISYYPNWPFTLIFPVRKTEDGYRVVGYGERGLLAVVIARPEVLVVKVEDETAIRAPPAGPFRWDGFADPRRVVHGGK
ncbi:conserved protein of unknown function [Thermococcus nautili]|uniref:hypothetical protein n=1 Tax=Thermococcus nautili TaxID=195522 RepID=UPI002553924D|nr:hypothetical protein [Thermococcus nautili]CAI1493731.1 conserved protein of unknown function [Thermococcus nautili]